MREDHGVLAVAVVGSRLRGGQSPSRSRVTFCLLFSIRLMLVTVNVFIPVQVKMAALPLIVTLDVVALVQYAKRRAS